MAWTWLGRRLCGRRTLHTDEVAEALAISFSISLPISNSASSPSDPRRAGISWGWDLRGVPSGERGGARGEWGDRA